MLAGLIQLSGRRYIQATRWSLTTRRGGRDHSSCFIGAAGRATCQLLIMRALRPGVVVPFVTLRDDLLAAALFAHGVQPVGQVSIDGTWSLCASAPRTGKAKHHPYICPTSA